MSDAEEFRTKDMSLAAFLVTKGHNFDRMTLDEDSCFWVFSETDELHEDLFDFIEDRGTVEPRKYSSSFARLKDEMFDFLRASGVPTGRRS